ncbi:hypothetical protein N7456_010067 [Penicillium angulare]|uniref:Tyrosinase copper-binding domain-containing protein n=1 Tax=Penicillium angulare TaxID=116970 RepID=A0A9W9F5X8_9EURO|nr:hypothetical protein N7456_010067 [Penicillium angulare]
MLNGGPDYLTQSAVKVTRNKVSAQQTGYTLEKLRIRRNWRAFSVEERKAYIDSVLCLQSLPSRTPYELAKGSKARYDDFVATHINQSTIIHRSGLFVAWNRYFIHELELALQNECNYSGDYTGIGEQMPILWKSHPFLTGVIHHYLEMGNTSPNKKVSGFQLETTRPISFHQAPGAVV